MLDLDSLQQLLSQQSGGPPLEKWAPGLSGDMDMLIKSNGDWIHEGRKIHRHGLVQTFASILRREADGEYYLLTPVEKWRIKVEAQPLLIVDMLVAEQGGDRQSIAFTTNVGVSYSLSQQCPLIIERGLNEDEPLPLLGLPHGLQARLARSVFYRLAELAEEADGELVVRSEGRVFALQ